MKWPNVPRPDITLRDLHVYGGLVLAAVGGWRVELGLEPAWTFVMVGLVLTVFGVFVPRQKGA